MGLNLCSDVVSKRKVLGRETLENREAGSMGALPTGPTVVDLRIRDHVTVAD